MRSHIHHMKCLIKMFMVEGFHRTKTERLVTSSKFNIKHHHTIQSEGLSIYWQVHCMHRDRAVFLFKWTIQVWSWMDQLPVDAFNCIRFLLARKCACHYHFSVTECQLIYSAPVRWRAAGGALSVTCYITHRLCYLNYSHFREGMTQACQTHTLKGEL